MNSIHRISQCAIARTIDRGTKSLRLAIAPSGYGNERSHQTTSMPGKRFGFTRSNPLDYDTGVGCSSLLSRSILQQRHKSYRCCSRDPKIWPLGVVMFNYPHLFTRPRPRSRCFWLILSISIFSASGLAQTSATGAVIGIVLDPSGAVVPSALIRISKESGGASQSTSSDDNGRFAIQLLPPGTYQLQTSRTDFKTLLVSDLHIYVTEVLRLELHLQLAAHAESSQVFSNSEMLQTGSAGLGRIVNEGAVNGLPLATRNFAQIIGLSPGVSVGVYNAGELGLGGIALSQISSSNDGIYVHGTRSYDNNYQLDGISVSDVQGSASGSGGTPIPNPDSIQEFKVQTALYDAGFGRYGGANTSLVTKTGGNDVHGTLFEFLRNQFLNANDFFLSQTHQPRPVLKQNQFGFAIGGPIRKDTLLFFGSYQGTRQLNGLAAGQSRTACTASLTEPPLTNDRSAAALGRIFGGMRGALGGISSQSRWI